ncbi:MAG: aldolase/citrate lyase family protein [Chloroflexi bacterium]|nr:aldolase/citrate lyase family protein [Chloroflexota bacterium]
MKNLVKEKIRSGSVVVGAQLRFGSPAIAEMFGHAGFDFLVVDSEHAPQTAVGIQHQLQAISCTPATPIVRVTKNDPDMMRPFLDMGAGGILAPFIRGRDDASLGARALRYPPVGTRGFGPSRAWRYGFDPDYYRRADDDMLFIPIIEDVEAVRNIDEILSTDGVDTFVIGPADLSFSLGIPMQFEHPKFLDAIGVITRAGLHAGKPMGTSVYGGNIFDVQTYRRFVDQGYTVLLIGGDEWMLADALRRLEPCVRSWQK